MLINLCKLIIAIIIFFWFQLVLGITIYGTDYNNIIIFIQEFSMKLILVILSTAIATLICLVFCGILIQIHNRFVKNDGDKYEFRFNVKKIKQ